MKKLCKEGLVAVLVSRGYGAGWTTWNYQYPEMLFDPDIAQMILDCRQEDDILALATARYPDAYLGGLEGLFVQWVPEGVRFRVHEYDGAESLEFQSEMEWHVA